MKLLLLIFIFLHTFISYSKDNYEFKIMGNSLKNDILKLPNKSIFSFSKTQDKRKTINIMELDA